MPELLRKQVSARSSRVWLLAWTLPLAALPALAQTESLPASVRACAAVTDLSSRLQCYDREVARFPAPAAKAAATAASATSPATQGALAPASAPASHAATKGTAPPGAPPTASSSNTAAPSAPTSAPATASTSNTRAPPDGNTSPDNPQHLTARVVSIERVPNEMILHLDNGQVWQQVQGVSGDLSLREGDTVKIDKQLGSYWLSGPHVASMKVRQKG